MGQFRPGKGMAELPTGTVTFLFTDIEGSTQLLRDLGAERYAEALAAHRQALRAAFRRHGGVEVDTQGDAFFVAFPTAAGAIAAAAEAQRALVELTALLRDSVRAVTLTGPGGSGKTRLAVQVGAELVDHFVGGVFFVPLAAIADPNLVVQALESATGAQSLDELGRWKALLVI